MFRTFIHNVLKYMFALVIIQSFPNLHQVSFTTLYGQEISGNSTIQDCVSPDSNIVAWWAMDEDSGGVVADIIGSNSGLRRNGTLIDSGIVGNSLRFDGSNDYVGIPDNNIWTFGSNDFTIEFWANFDRSGSGSIGHPGDVFISHNEGSGARRKWFFALGGGVLNFHINGSNSNGFYPRVPFSPVVGQWYHLALSRSGNVFKKWPLSFGQYFQFFRC